MELPWWVSVAFAAVVYLLLRFVAPAWFSGQVVATVLGQAAKEYAWLFALFFLIPAPIAALRQYRRKNLLDAQADLTSIRSLTWQEFEKLVAEWFHRVGYSVVEEGGPHADGGIDLIARGKDEKILIQCKHWRARVVGVAVVRELYGVMTAERATGGALITSGSFSADAIEFASGKSIQLIDGSKLERLVHDVRTNTGSNQPRAVLPEVACPDCGSPMVKRTARKGKSAGQQFWGCSRYPACRGIQQVA
jgi:restriction system protein